jgi:hypothetical protein
MMKRITHTAAALACIALLHGCKKDEVSVAPTISIANLSNYTVVEYTNAIEVTINYEDHQGDIGTTDPDEHSLFVSDERFAEQDGYHIDPLTPDLQSLHVRGSLRVSLRPLFIMGNDSIETTRLTFELRDRAGNVSNRVMTEEITIVND